MGDGKGVQGIWGHEMVRLGRGDGPVEGYVGVVVGSIPNSQGPRKTDVCNK